MLKKSILLGMMVVMLMASSNAFAEGKYSIKHMTPEVKAALDSRHERFDELRALKSSGVMGENNHGYVEVLKAQGNAQGLAAAENKDRRTIYQTIAEQNGLEDAVGTIESVFAQVQRDKAEAGDKIQGEDGQWTTK